VSQNFRQGVYHDQMTDALGMVICDKGENYYVKTGKVIWIIISDIL